MHWVIEALANVFLETLGDMMSFAVQLLTDFDFKMGLNIGYDSQTSAGAVITGTIMGHNNLFEQTFPGVTSFTPWIMAFAAGLAMVIYITKMIIAMGGPFTKSEDPGTLTVRFVFACTGVAFAYSIVAFLEMTFNGIYGKFMDTFVLLTKDAKDYAKNLGSSATSTTSNAYDNANDAWHSNEVIAGTRTNGDSADAFSLFGKDLINPQNGAQQNLAFALIEIAVFTVLLVAFAKLILEIYERYVMLGVLFFFAPLPFATLISPNSNIFSSYIQMVICEFIVMCSNLFFTGIFIKAWIGLLNTSNAYLFETKAHFITTMFLLISWLIIGQQFDQHLKGLGLSTATTGAGLGGAMMAGAGAAAGAISAASSAVGFGAKVAGGQTSLQRGMQQGTGLFRDGNSIGKSSAQRTADKNLKNWDSGGLMTPSGKKMADALANGDQKAIGQFARNVDASMGGNGTFEKELKKATGQGVSDIASMSYANGVLRGTTSNGQEFAMYNTHAGADSSGAQTASIGNGSGWEVGLRDDQVNSMISKHKAENEERLTTKNSYGTIEPDYRPDGSVQMVQHYKDKDGSPDRAIENAEIMVPGLKAGATAIPTAPEFNSPEYNDLKNA